MKRLFSLLLAVVLLLAGCGAAQSSDESFMAMDTFMNLRVLSPDSDEAALLRAEVERLDRLFSPTAADSDIARLNAAGEATVDGSTAELLTSSLALCGELDGALDLTVYPIVQAWGFISKDYRIPDRATLDELLAHTGYDAVTVEGSHVTMPEGFALDVGAVAKGYAADRCVAMLRQGKASGAILNLGGTVAAYGKKDGGADWTVGIADPENSARYIGYVSCSDKIVATSGSYERYFVGDDGVTYSHIIDPQTGCPVQNELLSVTIISDSGLRSDALSTALFVKGADGAAEYYRAHGGFEYILLTADRQVLLSDGIRNNFTLTDSGWELEVRR